jgi:two-component system response regulator YesN
MLHKVFLVEDEIVTREGIRDSVDWAAAGYQFCGEAPDGEIALPLIQERKPDTVITDIRMPFMDGLQLCRLVKETLPATRIIILSGHSEFKYAQEAIGLGVTEYLLKPVSAQELLAVLGKVGRQIEQERRESDQVRALELQSADYSAILRERLLLDLVTGRRSSGEVIAQGRGLGLDLLAPWYQLLVVQTHLDPDADIPAETLYRQVWETITAVTGDSDQIIAFRKDPAETILILKGTDPDQLCDRKADLANRLRTRLEDQPGRRVTLVAGQPGERLGLIAAAYSELRPRLAGLAAGDRQSPGWRSRLAKPDTAVIAGLLRSGVRADFDRSFAAYLAPLGDTDSPAACVIDYVFTDLVLTATSFVRELDGESSALLRELSSLESRLSGGPSLDDAKELIRQVIVRVLDYRDQQAQGAHGLIARAQAYIEEQYADPEISLQTVAAQVFLTPSYFSFLFARETHETFIEYLTRLRIARARNLLRSTALPSSEVAYQVGYNNPRYFYAVFRKVVGVSPTEFRHPAAPPAPESEDGAGAPLKELAHAHANTGRAPDPFSASPPGRR